MLSDDEQLALKKKISALQTEIEAEEKHKHSAASFLRAVRKYTDIQELTPSILNEYIAKIVVHEADKKGNEREQTVDFYFNFIGKVDLPAEEPVPLTPEEIAAQAKTQHRKQKQREYFQRWAAKNRPPKGAKTPA